LIVVITLVTAIGNLILMSIDQYRMLHDMHHDMHRDIRTAFWTLEACKPFALLFVWQNADFDLRVQPSASFRCTAKTWCLTQFSRS
jgi:hypothetical protein